MMKNLLILGFLAVLWSCNSNKRTDWAALAEETQTEVVDTSPKEYVLPLSVDKIDFEVLATYFRYRNLEDLALIADDFKLVDLDTMKLLKVDFGQRYFFTTVMADSVDLYGNIYLIGNLKTPVDMPKILIFMIEFDSWCHTLLLVSVDAHKKVIAMLNAASFCGDGGDFVLPKVKKAGDFRYLTSHMSGSFYSLEKDESNNDVETTEYSIYEGYFSILKNGVFKEVVTRVDSNLYEINVIKQ
jgi:hypothetical protein